MAGINSLSIDLLGQISPCALKCLLAHSPTFGCSPTDIECQCGSSQLYDLVSRCMVETCTIQEATAFSKVDAQLCNRPVNKLQGRVQFIVIICTFLLYAAYALRILARAFIARRLWWDDWFHTLAAVFNIPMAYGVVEFSRLGFGNHTFQIEADNMPTIWVWFFVGQILWAVNMVFLKVSVMCLYLRIFPSSNFKIACFSVMIVCVVGAIIFIGLDLFQCNPVSAGWTLQRSPDATCMDFPTIAIGGAVYNILTEVAVLILPIPVVARLKLQRKKKLEICALLGLGLVVIIVAAIRIPTLWTLGTYSDGTYRNYPAFLWTSLELALAHICAAAPAIKLLVTKMRSVTRERGSFPTITPRRTGSGYEIQSILTDLSHRKNRAEENYENEVQLRPQRPVYIRTDNKLMR